MLAPALGGPPRRGHGTTTTARAYGAHSGFAARPRRPIDDLIAACSR
ncbi:MAG: hypothetical protein J2P28_16695 [Actinobacteria bacterium]|nr:hypothetical protein [Actinomycetota bacterium]